MIRDIFKIGVYDKEIFIDNDVLINYANFIEKKSQGVKKTNRGGFQSNDLVDDCLNELQNKIVECVNDYTKQINMNVSELKNIWCNINYYKDYNVLHDHGNKGISGVYYSQTPKNCGNIIFFHPAWQLNQGGSTDSVYTSPGHWLPAKKGVLYLFPSWLLHQVEPNLNKDEKRISYSFNVL